MNIKSMSGTAILSAACAINHSNAAQVNLGNGYMLDTQYGQIVEKYINPKSKKTILYVLDIHPATPAGFVLNDDFVQNGLQTQKNAFLILDSFFSTGKKTGLGLVHEGWDSKSGESQEELVRRNLAGFGLKLNLRNTKDEKSPLDGGYNRAQQLAGTSVQQSANLLSAVYFTAGGKIEHIVPKISEKIKMYDDIKNIVVKGSMADKTPISCSSIGRKSSRTIGELLSYSGMLTKDERLCLCDGVHESNRTNSTFGQHRYIDAARAEIDAAANSKYSYVVVNVGAGHAFHGLKYARDKGLSYVVIAPNGVDPALAKTDLLITDTTPDDKFCMGTPAKNKKLSDLINANVESMVKRYNQVLRKVEKQN